MNPDDPIKIILQWENEPPEPPIMRARSQVEEFKNRKIKQGFKVVSETDILANLAAAKTPQQAAISAAEADAAKVQLARNAVRKEVGSAPRAFVSGALDGLSSNWLDEATGVINPEAKERMRSNVKIQKSESPNAYATGQTLGSIAQQFGLSRLMPSLRTPAGQLGLATVEGGISSLGAAEDIASPEEAAAIATTGAIGGGVGQVLGSGIGKAATGGVKKLIGNTAIEGAQQIEERLAQEALGKQLAEFNASKATGNILRQKAAEESAAAAAQQLKIPGFIGMPTAAQEAEKAFTEQFLANKEAVKAAAKNFQTQYPDPFSVGGALGSYGGSEAADLQSYQNKLTQALISGNQSIDSANAALAASGPITIPNVLNRPLTPAEERQAVVNAALDRIIQMNKQPAALPPDRFIDSGPKY